MKSPMAAKNEERAGKIFTHKDKSGDGKLDLAEFSARPGGGKGNDKGKGKDKGRKKAAE